MEAKQVHTYWEKNSYRFSRQPRQRKLGYYSGNIFANQPLGYTTFSLEVYG